MSPVSGYLCPQCGATAFDGPGAHAARCPTSAGPPENLTITLELPRIGKRSFSYRYRWVKGWGWKWYHADQDGRGTADQYGWQTLLDGIAESERRQVRHVIDNAAAMFTERIRATYVELGMTLDEIDRDAQEVVEQTAWLARHAEALAEIDSWAVGL